MSKLKSRYEIADMSASNNILFKGLSLCIILCVPRDASGFSFHHRNIIPSSVRIRSSSTSFLTPTNNYGRHPTLLQASYPPPNDPNNPSDDESNTDGNSAEENQSRSSKKQDVSDLFAAYMSNRSDEPLGTTNSKPKSSNNESSIKNPEEEDITSPTKWWPSPVKRVTKRFLKDENKNLVQPISLDGTPLNPDSDSSSQEDEEKVVPITSNFQALFEGVPKLDNILNGPSEPSQEPSQDTQGIKSDTDVVDMESLSNKDNGDELDIILTDEDINEINTKLRQLRSDMMEKYSTLLKENPNVDLNYLLNSVLDEQRQTLTSQKIEQRRMEQFQEYQDEKKALQTTMGVGSGNANNNNIKVDEDLVEELLTEVEEETKVIEKLSSRIQDFKEYEKSLRARHRSQSKQGIPNMASSSSESKVVSTKDFDQIQLNVMKDLLFKRQSAAMETDKDDVDLENIEDGIEELQDLLTKKNVMTQYPKPENPKEWQMYRAIATRLNEEKKKVRAVMPVGSEGRKGDESDEEDVATITRLLEAWKEFKTKEEQMRKDSGLSIKVRMPFEWNEESSSQLETPLPKPKGPINIEKAEEAKTEMDNVAVKVIQDLISRTADPERREKLKQELEELKVAMDTRQKAVEKMKREGKFSAPQKTVKPITIGSVLKQKKATIQQKQNLGNKNGDSAEVISRPESFDDIELSDLDDEEEDEIDVVDSFLIQDDEESIPAPPKSAFFAEDEELFEEEDTPIEVQDDSEDVPTLGTMKEQKFRSLVARSGVRTIEEQKKLQEGWEDFQKAEQNMRNQIGLSGRGSDAVDRSETNIPGNTKITYDTSAIFKEDGDIDVDAILGSIGKRPTRGQNRKVEGTNQDIKVAAAESLPSRDDISTILPEEVEEEDMTLDELRRDIPKDDLPPNDDKGRQSFPGFEETSLEQVERQHLKESLSGFEKRKSNLLDFSVLSIEQLNSLMELKRSESATSFSPYMARINKPYSEFGCIFSLEGALVDILGLQYESWKKVARIYDFNIPSIEDVKYASVHEDEYAVRKIFFWTDDIFATRKIKQTFREIRSNLFEEWLSSRDETMTPQIESENHKGSLGFDDPSTNADQNPENEEDILQLQHMAWSKVAQKYNFEAPTLNIVQLAQTWNPEESVRGVFRWTRDFMLSNEMASDYRKFLQEETSAWMEKKGVKGPSASGKRRNDQESESFSKDESKSSNNGPSQGDVIGLKFEAWKKVAIQFDFPAPSIDEVLVAEFLTPIEAIGSVFNWDVSDKAEPDSIVRSFRSELQKLSKELIEKNGIISNVEERVDHEEQFPLLTPKEGALEFLAMLEDVELPCAVLSNFDGADVDRIIDVTGLSRFFPENKRVSASQNYEVGQQQLLGCALRLEKRPDHCITLSCTPQAAAIAHDIEMKNIAVVGPYPYYELVAADLTVRDLGAVNLMNVRNVFSETNMDEPMQQLQVEGPKERAKTMLKTRYWDDGDR